jgi:hypothetical protein
VSKGENDYSKGHASHPPQLSEVWRPEAWFAAVSEMRAVPKLLVSEDQGRELDLEEPDPGNGGGEGLVPDENGGSNARDAALQLRLGHLGQPKGPPAT